MLCRPTGGSHSARTDAAGGPLAAPPAGSRPAALRPTAGTPQPKGTGRREGEHRTPAELWIHGFLPLNRLKTGVKESGLATSQSERQVLGAWSRSAAGSSHS